MAKITTGTANGDIKITPNGTGKTVVGTGAANATVQSSGNHDLVLQTGNLTTGSITITDGANGNIAISPNGTGNVTLGGNLVIPNSGTIGSVGDTDAITIDASGNVGIGTGSPSSDLHISAGGSADITIEAGINQCQIVMTNAGATDYKIRSDNSPDGLIFSAGATDAVTIDSSGNVTLAEKLIIDPAKGIQFRTTTGGGGSFGSGILDDYEEGTWTPTNAGDATGTLTNPSGLYVKIGRTVIVTAVGAVGTAFTGNYIAGLPFQPSAYGSYADKSRALVGSSRAIKLTSSSSYITFTDVNGTISSVSSFRFTITYITD